MPAGRVYRPLPQTWPDYVLLPSSPHPFRKWKQLSVGRTLQAVHVETPGSHRKEGHAENGDTPFACGIVQLKSDDAREEEVNGKLANGVGSQYPSHYLGTSCIQHYYRWCAHLGCASSRLNWRHLQVKWTRPFRRKTKSGFCACAITFQLASTYCVFTGQ